MESLRGNGESGAGGAAGEMPPPPHSDAESGGGGHDTLDSHKSGHTDPGGHTTENRGNYLTPIFEETLII